MMKTVYVCVITGVLTCIAHVIAELSESSFTDTMLVMILSASVDNALAKWLEEGK